MKRYYKDPDQQLRLTVLKDKLSHDKMVVENIINPTGLDNTNKKRGEQIKVRKYWEIDLKFQVCTAVSDSWFNNVSNTYFLNVLVTGVEDVVTIEYNPIQHCWEFPDGFLSLIGSIF